MEFAPKNPVPVFPLPDIVLFPHTVVPLHIFELRYRTMVRDALSDGRMLALAVLKPGWEREYHSSPAFHALACLARIEDVEWLPNDCYDLHLMGLYRVQIGRVTREYPYRLARVEPVPQAPLTEDDPLVQIERRALIEACHRWAKCAVLPGEILPSEDFGEGLTFEKLVNAVCVGMAAESAEKLDLLALDSLIERGRRAREHIERRLRMKPAPPTPPTGDMN